MTTPSRVVTPKVRALVDRLLAEDERGRCGDNLSRSEASMLARAFDDQERRLKVAVDTLEALRADPESFAGADVLIERERGLGT